MVCRPKAADRLLGYPSQFSVPPKLIGDPTQIEVNTDGIRCWRLPHLMVVLYLRIYYTQIAIGSLVASNGISSGKLRACERALNPPLLWAPNFPQF